jgi:hypothetical protein
MRASVVMIFFMVDSRVAGVVDELLDGAVVDDRKARGGSPRPSNRRGVRLTDGSQASVRVRLEEGEAPRTDDDLDMAAHGSTWATAPPRPARANTAMNFCMQLLSDERRLRLIARPCHFATRDRLAPRRSHGRAIERHHASAEDMSASSSNPNQGAVMSRKIKFVTAAVTALALAAPAASMAAAPDGDYAGTIKDGATTSLTAHGSTNDSASLVGEYSARSVQNGQFISGNDGTTDQTTTPGSRAALIQGYLGHTK